MKNKNSFLSTIFKLLTTGDKILILIFFLFGFVSLFALQRYQQPGSTVLIKIANNKIYRYNLDKDREINLHGPIGTTRILIHKGKVRVIHSDCPQKICVKSGWISGSFEIIVCVPNKIIIAIESKNNQYFDVITQ
ncbi:hypothetical protein B6I21_07125 [candidate division KSB1 bacterium 4572_119]|nr:MAG: hypothetical protein B6I21_07125 [candidate division KSB1 bacterium 4572_119]